MKKQILYYSLVSLISGILLTGCSITKKNIVPQTHVIYLNLTANAVPNKYVDMDYGIRLQIRDLRSDSRILQKHDSYVVSTPQVSVQPNVQDFVSESMRRYMRVMGFNLDADIATDYLMSVSVNEYKINYLSGMGWAATVQMQVSVTDKDHQPVYPTVTVSGRATQQGNGQNFTLASNVLNLAYERALEDIDWDRIAFFLKRQSSPSQEKNKQVTGEGNTALESTIIRWFVDSTPKGADVYTRVISSTPEVKNTNQTYVGTTPYETTEAFDIKGLTFNNSGNIQIEIVCEKAGYVVQKKRFNLRQAIDQKEIATKFNLIKEEE